MTELVYDGLPRAWGAVVALLRRLARAAGLLGWLERRRDAPALFYIRCLFAYYDIADMAHLDVPFWTFRAARQADAFLASRGGRAVVFEWGAGASTLWLSRRAGQVHSVDHDARWGVVVRGLAQARGNVDLRVVPPGPKGRAGRFRSRDPLWRGRDFEAYVRAIEQVPGAFDLIAIDGRCRAECLEAALPRLKPDGLIVFDNAYRPRYRAAIRASGLVLRRFWGAVPGLPFPEGTTLMAHDRRALGPGPATPPEPPESAARRKAPARCR